MALCAVPGFKQLGAALRIAVLGPQWGKAERRKEKEFGDGRHRSLAWARVGAPRGLVAAECGYSRIPDRNEGRRSPQRRVLSTRRYSFGMSFNRLLVIRCGQNRKIEFSILERLESTKLLAGQFGNGGDRRVDLRRRVVDVRRESDTFAVARRRR